MGIHYVPRFTEIRGFASCWRGDSTKKDARYEVIIQEAVILIKF